MQPPSLPDPRALLATALGACLLVSGCQHSLQHDRSPASDPQQHTTNSLAQEQRQQPAQAQDMHVVPHATAANAPGHGWRYFTNPAARRAVVISPQEDYYYSRGDGPHWVAAKQY